MLKNKKMNHIIGLFSNFPTPTKFITLEVVFKNFKILNLRKQEGGNWKKAYKSDFELYCSKNCYFVNISVPSFSNMTFICFTETHLLPWTDQTENQPSTSDDSNCSGGLNSIAKFNII